MIELLTLAGPALLAILGIGGTMANGVLTERRTDRRHKAQAEREDEQRAIERDRADEQRQLDQRREDRQRRYDERRGIYLAFWRELKRKQFLIETAHLPHKDPGLGDDVVAYIPRPAVPSAFGDDALERIIEARKIDLTNLLADLELVAAPDTLALASIQVRLLKVAPLVFDDAREQAKDPKNRTAAHITQYMEKAPEMRRLIRRDLGMENTEDGTEGKTLGP